MNPLIAKIIPAIPTLLKSKGSWVAVAAAIFAAYLLTGNAISSLDWMWSEPRDLLVDRVQDARDSQQRAAEDFQDALAEFKAVVDLPESDLERQYRKLDKAHKRSKAAAEDINKQVDRVVDASNRLLEEWREELKDYNDPALRRLAEQQFDQTRGHATQLIASMREIEDRMTPVLNAFQDQVLYLKHNLNLSAIAALEGEAAVIESDVDALIADMNRSIAEADAFIRAMLESNQA